MVPLAYRLTLRPNLSSAVFDGSVDITVDVIRSTWTIQLNAAELKVSKASISTEDEPIDASTMSANAKDELLTLSWNSPLPVGLHTLRLRFTGVLNDQMRGFYLSKYTDDHGHEQRIATTQFEATDCRRSLPCFDEPALKATFTVILEAPTHLRALSNMPAVSSTPLEGPDAGWTRHEFASEAQPLLQAG